MRPRLCSPSSPKGTPVGENRVDIEAGLEVCAKATNANLCVDDFIVHPGDGAGQWFVYDAEEDDGPVATFDNEGDARMFVSARTGWPAALAELRAVREENRRLRKVEDAAKAARRTMCTELNMSKYNDDDVAQLNSESTEACAILDAALKGTP